jgi:hypothetical protein
MSLEIANLAMSAVGAVCLATCLFWSGAGAGIRFVRECVTDSTSRCASAVRQRPWRLRTL